MKIAESLLSKPSFAISVLIAALFISLIGWFYAPQIHAQIVSDSVIFKKGIIVQYTNNKGLSRIQMVFEDGDMAFMESVSPALRQNLSDVQPGPQRCYMISEMAYSDDYKHLRLEGVAAEEKCAR